MTVAVATSRVGVAPPPAPRPSWKGGTILVTGATGSLGGAVVHRLRTAGWEPRALAPAGAGEKTAALRAMGVEVVEGDLGDPSTLRPALDGVHGVFSVQDSRAVRAAAEVRQGIAMADAARVAGVQHFVYSSVASADRGSRIDHFETKLMVEKHIRWIGLKRTILRPVLLMEDFLEPAFARGVRRGWFADPLPRNRKVQMVSAQDVAAFAVAAFDDPSMFMGKVIELAGDEVTNGEVADAFSAAAGRRVRFRRIPMILVRPFRGRNMHRMYRWLKNTGFAADIQDLRNRYPGIGLTSLDDWLRQRGKGAGKGNLTG